VDDAAISFGHHTRTEARYGLVLWLNLKTFAGLYFALQLDQTLVEVSPQNT
jgi:hypothetical protein